jgi:hypothetical protein
MTITQHFRAKATTALALALAGPMLSGVPALAGWPHHKKQTAYVLQAPVVTAQAPVMYTAQAPVAYTAQAPVTYAAQAPVTYAAQAPVTYAAQAPVTYAAQAPATYTMTTGSAPVVGTTATGAAPMVGSAPSAEGNRISAAVRHALFADLVPYYHSQESGETQIEKIRALRERAREGYAAALEGEEDPELNPSEVADLGTLVDLVISRGTGSAQRMYHPQLAPPGYPGDGGTPPGYGYNGGGGPSMIVGQAPTTFWVPVYLQSQPHRRHFSHKH